MGEKKEGGGEERAWWGQIGNRKGTNNITFLPSHGPQSLLPSSLSLRKGRFQCKIRYSPPHRLLERAACYLSDIPLKKIMRRM